MPELYFRAALEADLTRLKEIDRRAFSMEEQYEDDVYATFLSQPRLQTIVACAGANTIVGYALLDTADTAARLRSIAVDPAYRRRGFGDALLIKSIELAGHDDVELFVERGNAEAIRLYERAGFYFVPNCGELPDRLKMVRRKTGTESAGFNAVFAVLNSEVYREAIAESSKEDPFPDWVVPLSFTSGSELGRVAQELRVTAGEAFVDLACGLGGPGMWVALRTGARLTGVDFSAAAVKLASKRAEQRGLEREARFVEADMTHTGLPSESFDALMSIDALPFADPRAVCTEISRLLHRGGRIALTTFEVAHPTGRSGVADYRPYLDAANLDVHLHEENHDWPARAKRFYDALLTRAERLRAEVGEAAEHLLCEAAKPPLNRRVFIAATKR